MKNLNTIIFASILIAAQACHPNTESESFELNGSIDRVVVNVDVGEVILKVGDNSKGALVDVEIGCRTAVPRYDIYLQQGTLYVELNAGTGASACDGTFDITVPKQISADLNTGSGDIVIKGIQGDVKAVSYEGNITLDSIAGNLDIAAVSGNIDGLNLDTKEGIVESGNGNVDLSYTSQPTLVDVDIIMGNATIFVPESAYQIDASTDLGEVNLNGVTHLPDVTNTLILTVDSGDIVISGN